MKTKTTSQTETVLRYMQEGRKISPLEALNLFGCFRLGARIWDLKQRGIEIASEMFTNEHGISFSRYWMPKFLKEVVK